MPTPTDAVPVLLRARALVPDARPEEVADLGLGLGVVRDGAAHVWLTARHARGLGPALLWARRRGARSLRLVAERDGGLLARRADMFAPGRCAVTVVDARLAPVAAAAHAPSPAVPPSAEAFSETIAASGADVVREHGVLTGEVVGLEVCRVAVDASTGAARLEVGVGAHDRETFAMLHGAEPPPDALARVVARVREARASSRAGAADPLARLAAERATRHAALAEPALVGAARLEAAEPPTPRDNVRDAVPCAAVGVDPQGRPLVAVFAASADPDVVPWAADARARLAGSEARLVVAMAPRNSVAAIRALADDLRVPARFVDLP
jgi:hypothetical protein